MEHRRRNSPEYLIRLCVPLEIAGVLVTIVAGVLAWSSDGAARVLPRGGMGVFVALVLFGAFGLIALKLPSAVVTRRARRIVRRYEGRVCTRCLQPLGTGDRCTECGLAIDAGTAAAEWGRIWPL